MSQTFAERYEGVLVPVIFVPWAHEMLRREPPGRNDHVLDLGCGTGVVTRQLYALAYRPASLTAVDHSADMLTVAQRLAETEHVPVDFHQTDAGVLPFENSSFHVAYCQQAFQFFPDKPRALHELRRVLAPDGRVAMCVQAALEINPMLKAQAETLEEFVGPDAGAAVRAICGFPEGEAFYELFDNAGFRHVDVETVALTLTHPDGRAFAAGAMGGMHTGDKIGGLTDADRERSIDAFLEALGPYYDGQAIRFPHVSNVITARA